MLDGFPSVYERRAALPRAYIVHEIRRAESEEQALAWVRALDFDPWITAIVNEDIGPLDPLEPVVGEVASIAEYRSQRVAVEASCASACLLVLTDLYDEDWRVRVNGVLAPLRQVNFLFRGVELTAGDHRVEFEYHPTAFYSGALISCIALSVFAGLAIMSNRRRPMASRIESR